MNSSTTVPPDPVLTAFGATEDPVVLPGGKGGTWRPPYWRPTSWAAAVVVADALCCWFEAPPELAARWSHLPAWDQMLTRALIYRIATDEAAIGPTVWTPNRIAAYQPVVDLAIAHSQHDQLRA